MKKFNIIAMAMIVFGLFVGDGNAGFKEDFEKFKKDVNKAAKNTGKVVNQVSKGTQVVIKQGNKLYKEGFKQGKNIYKNRDKAIKQGEKFLSLARSRYGWTFNKIRDPETKRQTMAVVGTILEVRSQIRAAKKSGVYAGFDFLAKIPVGGGKTFGDIATEQILKKYPNLGSAGLCEDPAETATAILLLDRRFFLEEAKILKKDGENISVYEAIDSSSSFNGNQILKFLKITVAAGDVADSIESGEDVGEAIGSVFSAIETAN